jgi:hypothetical protein
MDKVETAVDSPPRDPRSWVASSWIFFITAIFLLQTGFVVFLSRSPAGLQPKRSTSGSFKLLAGTPNDGLISKQLWILDPVLFGSASARNFSGLAWAHQPDFELNIPSWKEPPAYLEMSRRMPRLYQPASLEEYKNTFTDNMVAMVTAPTIPAVRPSSNLLMEQLPGGRKLREAHPLPLQPYTDVIGNSVVQAAVDRYGSVISARLISRSGSKTADADALNIAKLSRFESKKEYVSNSDSSSEVDWALFVFQWFTVPIVPADH